MKKTIGFLLSLLLMFTLTGGMVFAGEEQDAQEVPAAEEITEAAEEAAEAPAEDTAEAPAEDEAEEAVSLEDILGESEGISVEVPLSENGEIVIEDYSTIEVSSSQVAVQDEEVETMIASILEQSATTEVVTEGPVAEGDVVVMDFSGKLDGEEEPFEGGTAEGVSAQIGAGTFIPGFEEQIVGHEIGETFDIHITFPEEYTEELAGKDATFTITVKNKSVTTVPELTDEFVQKFASENIGEDLQTVDELRQFIHEYLYENYLMNAIMTQLQSKTTVVSYPEARFQLMKEYSFSTLSDYVTLYAMQGMGEYTEDMLAQISGYASSDDYTNAQAMSYLDSIMMADKIAEDLGIEVTDEEFDAYMKEVLAQNGISEDYSLDDLNEVYGEGWVTINRYNLLISKELTALEERAVIVETGMTHQDFLTANVDDEVMVDMYVQDTQAFEDGKISVYGAAPDGGYFVYNMECTEEDAAKLVPGTKIRVTGYKAEWSGELEIADATFEFAEDPEDTFIQEPVDVTAMLGTSELVDYMNQYVSFTGLTVESSVDADGNESAFLYNWDGSGTQGDDIYFNVSVNGETYTFLIESKLRGQDSDVYKAAEALNIGDTIDAEGFLYWYEGANPHITSITVK